MNTSNIEINKYTYELPDERIAKYPLNDRSQSKLLIYNSSVKEDVFKNIYQYLPANSLLVFNNTKVIQARLEFQKETGAKIEIFCLEPIEPADINISFQSKTAVQWKCIVGNSKKWKEGFLQKKVRIDNHEVFLKISRLDVKEDSQIIKFEWDNNLVSFGDIIENTGVIPIPPYLNRETEAIDTERYQTVYSKHKGSVAAPTAGLHFTDEILESSKLKHITIDEVTLHVGAGTFKPVKSEKIKDHEMHIEHFFVNISTIENLIKYENNITCTGTTTMRTLESIYWLGVKLLEGSNELFIRQWDPYNLPQHYSFKDALNRLKVYLADNDLTRLESFTGILIAPGYQFKIVNRLITNFHQPNSTLLLLIAAFTGGDKWKDIYNYALENNFRFLSYGDSSLLVRE